MERDFLAHAQQYHPLVPTCRKQVNHMRRVTTGGSEKGFKTFGQSRDLIRSSLQKMVLPTGLEDRLAGGC